MFALQYYRGGKIIWGGCLFWLCLVIWRVQISEIRYGSILNRFNLRPFFFFFWLGPFPPDFSYTLSLLPPFPSITLPSTLCVDSQSTKKDCPSQSLSASLPSRNPVSHLFFLSSSLGIRSHFLFRIGMVLIVWWFTHCSLPNPFIALSLLGKSLSLSLFRFFFWLIRKNKQGRQKKKKERRSRISLVDVQTVTNLSNPFDRFNSFNSFISPIPIDLLSILLLLVACW